MAEASSAGTIVECGQDTQREGAGAAAAGESRGVGNGPARRPANRAGLLERAEKGVGKKGVEALRRFGAGEIGDTIPVRRVNVGHRAQNAAAQGRLGGGRDFSHSF